MSTYKNKNINNDLNEELLELPEEFVEQLVCKQLLSPENSENTLFIHQNFKSDWFKSQPLKQLYKILYSYYEKNSGLPSDTLLYKIFEHEKFDTDRVKLTKTVQSLLDIDETKYDPKFLQSSMIEFTKGRALYHAILENIEDIEDRGDIKDCLARFEHILQIGQIDDVGIEYFDNLNNHIKDLTSNEERIPFKWTMWDKCTYGGIPVNEACLFIIMAQPGLGKSQTMMNIGYNYLLQNKNVLMVSLEMSEQMYSRRMSALFSDINVNQLKDHTEILKKKVTTTKLSIPSARLFIKQYSPNEFNSLKLKSLLTKLKKTKKFVPDLIIVDYLNIMTTNAPSYNMKSYERVGTISKELRSVSIETKLPILSSTQANRCLLTNTIVIEKDKGEIPLADINVGDKLLSKNHVYNTVIKKYDIESSKTYKITTISGKIVICTDIHEWPTADGNKTIANGLKIGDKLIQRTFFTCKDDEIISIEEYGINEVIDIEVTGDHLFFANNLLTHNSGTGYAGDDISMNNTSDSAGINMDADAIFALYQLEGERELGRINIKILKNRLGGYVNECFPMAVNYDTLKFSDWNGSSDSETEADNVVFEQMETKSGSNNINNNKNISEKTKENSEINDLFKDFE